MCVYIYLLKYLSYTTIIVALDLSHNHLAEIEKVHVMRLSWLLVLLLNDNRLKTISFDCFEDVSNLVKLDLAGNQINNIELVVRSSDGYGLILILLILLFLFNFYVFLLNVH